MISKFKQYQEIMEMPINVIWPRQIYIILHARQ